MELVSLFKLCFKSSRYVSNLKEGELRYKKKWIRKNGYSEIGDESRGLFSVSWMLKSGGVHRRHDIFFVRLKTMLELKILIKLFSDWKWLPGTLGRFGWRPLYFLYSLKMREFAAERRGVLAASKYVIGV